MEITPMVPEYKTELESQVVSHPPLESGHVAEREHERQMDVVPVVPEYKTELSTDLISRPELTSGHEARAEYERTLQFEAVSPHINIFPADALAWKINDYSSIHDYDRSTPCSATLNALVCDKYKSCIYDDLLENCLMFYPSLINIVLSYC
jgi:hypothetical protein